MQTDKEGYKSVDYSRLTPVLIEAIKEQQTIIDQQQSELSAVQEELTEIKALLQSMME